MSALHTLMYAPCFHSVGRLNSPDEKYTALCPDAKCVSPPKRLVLNARVSAASAGGAPLAIFYADVEAAKTELATAQKENEALRECDIIPVGLGCAFKLSTDSKAMIVPGRGELTAAGAPPDANPMGQMLPL